MRNDLGPLATILRHLFPREEQTNPAFRAECQRLSVIGLRVIGWVCVGAPLFMYAMGLFFLPALPDHSVLVSDMAQVTWGIVLLSLSYVRRLQPWARALGILGGGFVAIAQTGGLILSGSHEHLLGITPVQHFPTTIAIVLFVGVTALPVTPMQSFGLGSAILAGFLSILSIAETDFVFAGWSALPILLSVLVVLLCTGLTAVVYNQRAAAFQARQRAEQSFEELKEAQVSLLLERNAASSSRFAAALSHELNSPLGALGSSLETLWRLVESSNAFGNGDGRERSLFEDSIRAGRASLERLDAVVGRMRHLSNLDRADEQLVDLNELCIETAALLETELETRKLTFHFAHVPSVRCRPQQVSAVVANLLRNAADASSEGGEIRVRSLTRGRRVVVEVEDDGRGIPPEQLETLFEPAFHVEHGRVTTKNWGLFVSRSILAEHGGSLDVDSVFGRGTTASLELPATN